MNLHDLPAADYFIRLHIRPNPLRKINGMRRGEQEFVAQHSFLRVFVCFRITRKLDGKRCKIGQPRSLTSECCPEVSVDSLAQLRRYCSEHCFSREDHTGQALLQHPLQISRFCVRGELRS